MRFAFSFLFAILLASACWNAQSTDFPADQSTSTVVITNTFSFTSGGSYVGTNRVEFSNLHTVHAFTTSTNPSQFAVDRTLDDANWVIVATNAIGTNTGIGEQTATGKWRSFRYRIYGTNASGTIIYTGGK